MSAPLGSETQLSTNGARHVYSTELRAGENPTLNAQGIVEGPFDYETVAVSQTNQVMGAVGAVGDYISHLIIVVATAATAQVQLKDGAGTAFTVFPSNPGGGIGTYVVPLKMSSVNGAWQVTTLAGATVIGVGLFT